MSSLSAVMKKILIDELTFLSLFTVFLEKRFLCLCPATTSLGCLFVRLSVRPLPNL